jgi:polar amino acid transport system substrate-binding protein
LATLPAIARPLDQVKESSALTLCAHPNALPFSAKAGPRHGFQVEMAAHLAKIVGVALQTNWVITGRDVHRADCDILMDAIADPEAQGETGLSLSTPYRRGGVALAVRADNDTIHGLADLPHAGKIGILPGSMAAMYLGQHGVRTSPAGFETDLLDQIMSGELTGAAVTPVAIGYYNLSHPHHPLKMLDLFGHEKDLTWNIAVGMVRPDPALTAAIDAALKKLEAAGTIKAIYASYGVTLLPPRP